MAAVPLLVKRTATVTLAPSLSWSSNVIAADGYRVLPIWIGQAEATAIAMELQSVKPPRPMTHDLLRNMIAELNARVRPELGQLLRHRLGRIGMKVQRRGDRQVRSDNRADAAEEFALGQARGVAAGAHAPTAISAGSMEA